MVNNLGIRLVELSLNHGGYAHCGNSLDKAAPRPVSPPDLRLVCAWDYRPINGFRLIVDSSRAVGQRLGIYGPTAEPSTHSRRRCPSYKVLPHNLNHDIAKSQADEIQRQQVELNGSRSSLSWTVGKRTRIDPEECDACYALIFGCSPTRIGRDRAG